MAGDVHLVHHVLHEEYAALSGCEVWISASVSSDVHPTDPIAWATVDCPAKRNKHWIPLGDFWLHVHKSDR